MTWAEEICEHCGIPHGECRKKFDENQEIIRRITEREKAARLRHQTQKH